MKEQATYVHEMVYPWSFEGGGGVLIFIRGGGTYEYTAIGTRPREPDEYFAQSVLVAG